jgi:hypothetical protein
VLDADGDEIPDASDNCPVHENPGQEDANADGIGDACPSFERVRVRPGIQDRIMTDDLALAEWAAERIRDLGLPPDRPEVCLHCPEYSDISRPWLRQVISASREGRITPAQADAMTRGLLSGIRVDATNSRLLDQRLDGSRPHLTLQVQGGDRGRLTVRIPSAIMSAPGNRFSVRVDGRALAIRPRLSAGEAIFVVPVGPRARQVEITGGRLGPF